MGTAAETMAMLNEQAAEAKRKLDMRRPPDGRPAALRESVRSRTLQLQELGNKARSRKMPWR